MADNDSNNATPPRVLVPPAVSALKQEARDSASSTPSIPMARTPSEDIREEREDLREAAEQTLNIIVDVDLDGRVKWVSPSWKEVIGTPVEDVEGKPISDIVLDNKEAFMEAVESMKKDDSRSQIVRFAVKIGPTSVFWHEPRSEAEEGEEQAVSQTGESETQQEPEQKPEERDLNVLNMEGQGIMVFDRSTGGESEKGHTMWMLRPSPEPREVTIDLPPMLVESLGVGAEVLANYLTVLAEVGVNDPAHHPPPMPVLCRICERQITPWWFEKHSELCLQEHRAEMDVQMAQENLNEHRHAIVRVLDGLEARKGRSISGELSPQPEYKNLPIGPPSSSVSGSSSSSGTPPISRDPSTSGLGHSRGRSFAVRRPLARIVELILDLCDTALEISTPALKESRTESGEDFRTLSPQSESRISQVLQWQSPSSNTLDQEQGLAALAADTEAVARAKVDAVTRHRTIVEYGERIRVEFTLLVEECIAAAMNKAERIAAGELSDSSSSTSESPETEESREDFRESLAPPHASESASAPPGSLASSAVMAPPLRPPSDNAGGSQQDTRSSSVAVSTRSSSPMECPTPRSHRSVPGLLSQAAKRGSLLAESDAGADSDSSAPSSALTGGWRTESPSSERGLTRATSTRDRKRQSLILPGMSSSPRRESPARTAPHSPLRLSKPRLSLGESLPSPTTSPLLNTADLSGSSISQYYPSLSHHHHHRRQSSTTSPDSGRVPISPHLTSASHPPPRAVAPSIKDFEIVKPISKGAFGSVYLSKKKSTGEYFAIKVLKKADMVAKNQVTNVKAERAIMMWQGESDFVAKLYWTFSSKDYLYLVMEYLNGGDCASLVKVLGGLPEDWAKKYIAEVVLGVEHLHGRGIVHRDLKPDNLLIDQKGHLKLTDFGLSRMGLVGRQKRILKSPNESAPDLLKQGPFTKATSLASSRSASFDFPATQSPNSTPLITPEVGSFGQPSYFSLRESSLSREPSRRASGYRSDSGGSDTLNAMFRNFSLHDTGDTPLPVAFSSHITGHNQQAASNDEELQSEGSDSPHLFPLQQSISHQTSGSGQHSTPPQQSLMPPPMALFDPEDHNRIFVGTPDYLAPETINGVGQDEMSDWWSLGCILFEFLYGYPPFNASTPDEVFQNILNRRINWPDEADEPVTPEAKDIMNKLMTIQPEKRLGANILEKYPNGGAEIRAHPWFSDINWDTLLEDKAQFVPAPENLEDTEYFDPRGATLQSFTEELEDQLSPPTPGGVAGDYQDRPHDALFKVRSQVNTAGKRGMMPLHIPPHVRDSRSRRLSEPVLADDFGNFSFKNLPVLERANKDVIQKLRQEAMQAQQRPVPPNNPTPTSSGPSLEGSPLIPGPLKRTMSQNKPGNRPASPSSVSQANSNSPGRPSQPSSPLLVQFSTGQGLERRKTSGSSTFSHHSSGHHSSGSLQPGGTSEPPRLSTNFKVSPSSASSPIKQPKVPTPSPDKLGSVQRHSSSSTSRSRSQTVGSQDSEMGGPREPFVQGHHKRRSQLLDVSPSSSDNEDPRAKAFLKVQRRRQSSRRLSQINLPEGPHFRPLDVLICEDHPVSKLVMERLFEKLRCRTITAVNGSEAIRYALSEVQFDVIMMEFKLPQINGADVARMLRETRSPNTHTPIVAVTGYLKDLPEAHHFDALIEKPPTITKLTEALCKFCHWKPPPKETPTGQSLSMQPLVARHISNRLEDSPSSTTTSSSFVPMPASSYQGSSREDSLGSSYFGDLEAIKPEEMPVVISGQGVSEWADVQAGGLGISEEGSARQLPAASAPAPQAPHLTHSTTAPSKIPVAASTPRRHRSVDGIRAKRESLEKRRYEGAESGDDEDEELGHVQVRAKSPHVPSVTQGHSVRSGSKLGIEMMRTNSRGSVVSADEFPKEGGKDPEVLGAITSSPERIDEGVERLRGMDDVLETLPEDTEKEDSCTPHPPPSGSLEARTTSAPILSPADEIDKTLQTPTTSQTVPQSTPPKSPTAPQSGSETETPAQKGSLTPPSTVPKQETTTPGPQHAGPPTTEDTEATPRPPQGAGDSPAIETDTEPTPRASDRDRSRTRDKVMGWIRHK